jgi:hypothetical protein
MMGFTTSWAQVTYSSTPDSSKSTVSIKVTDMLNIPSYMSVAPSPSANQEHSVELGYKRTVSYNNLNVFETYDSASHQAKLQLTIATRFLIEVSGEVITDPSQLFSFLDRTDIQSLKRIAETGTTNQGK